MDKKIGFVLLFMGFLLSWIQGFSGIGWLLSSPFLISAFVLIIQSEKVSETINQKISSNFINDYLGSDGFLSKVALGFVKVIESLSDKSETVHGRAAIKIGVFTATAAVVAFVVTLLYALNNNKGMKTSSGGKGVKSESPPRVIFDNPDMVVLSITPRGDNVWNLKYSNRSELNCQARVNNIAPGAYIGYYDGGTYRVYWD